MSDEGPGQEFWYMADECICGTAVILRIIPASTVGRQNISNQCGAKKTAEN
jgi:hypothetical protein